MSNSKFEIWYADFPFEEDTSISIDHTVVLVDHLPNGRVRAMLITSTPSYTDSDMSIECWEQAGLEHLSFIRTRRAYNLDRSRLRRQLGYLSEMDAIRLRFHI